MFHDKGRRLCVTRVTREAREERVVYGPGTWTSGRDLGLAGGGRGSHSSQNNRKKDMSPNSPSSQNGRKRDMSQNSSNSQNG